MKVNNKGINKCPFCKSAKVYAYDTDFGDADGPLFCTVGCNSCGAQGPAVRMYSTDWWSKEQLKEISKRRTNNSKSNFIAMTNRDRAIDLWNAAGTA